MKKEGIEILFFITHFSCKFSRFSSHFKRSVGKLRAIDDFFHQLALRFSLTLVAFD
jgi:hypothetical protein